MKFLVAACTSLFLISLGVEYNTKYEDHPPRYIRIRKPLHPVHPIIVPQPVYGYPAAAPVQDAPVYSPYGAGYAAAAPVQDAAAYSPYGRVAAAADPVAAPAAPLVDPSVMVQEPSPATLVINSHNDAPPASSPDAQVESIDNVAAARLFPAAGKEEKITVEDATQDSHAPEAWENTLQS